MFKEFKVLLPQERSLGRDNQQKVQQALKTATSGGKLILGAP